MNSRARRSSLQPVSVKVPLKREKKKLEMSGNRVMDAENTTRSRKNSVRARKIALQQDVDKLKKRLRHEENVHRALERAFSRPLGARPRLPPYLPVDTLELVAEVAVLEEEVVRLEKKVVHFRQGLYQEAVYISTSKKHTDHSAYVSEPSPTKDPKPKQSSLLLQTGANYAASSIRKDLYSISDERRGKENHSSTNFSPIKQKSPNVKVQIAESPLKRPTTESGSAEKRLAPRKLQLENRVSDSENPPINGEEISAIDNCPNKISESILKCLMNIFLGMSSKKSRGTAEAFPLSSTLDSAETCQNDEFKDPYNVCSKFGKRDVGPYKHIFCIESSALSPNRTRISVFLLQRLKLLLQKLAAVDLKDLSHQRKLAFWINIYNACMMNAFIDFGIPENPEMVFALMQKATVNVGGHTVNAITIEHFILRLPYHSKYTFSKGAKHDETATRSKYGLELSEPLVTFALSCGSWSSPAVRVYTASEVETELETAKKDYLQAAVGISTVKNIIAIPKLLDWYLLDFAKDFESLLDWTCLQLPSELGKEAMKCIDSGKDEPLIHSFEIIPYEFSFRYIFHI